jgi:hypothetical protein
LYPPAALAQARHAFSNLCCVTEATIDRDAVLTIAPADDAPAETADEFLSYALSAALEIHLAVGG